MAEAAEVEVVMEAEGEEGEHVRRIWGSPGFHLTSPTHTISSVRTQEVA